ncbi:MAG: hypothetical protein QM724_12185 [Flavobacteriales bacterium]
MPSTGTVAERTPFEAWEEEGVIRLVLCNAAEIDLQAMRAVLRHVRGLDPYGGVPVVVEQEELVRMTPEARTLLARSCRNDERPVAFVAYDLPDRIQGEFFARFYQPHFPFRVCVSIDDAHRWIQAFSRLLRARG